MVRVTPTVTASVSMREFLSTGELGPIRLGSSVDSLKSVFGDPSDVGGTSRRRKPGIWKYGDVEFHLTNDCQRVCLIFCDSFEQLQFGPGASLDRWFFEGHPPVESVESELMSAGIGFQRHDMPHESSAFLLRLDCGIELLFSRGTDPVMCPGVPGLFGFQYADKNAG
jgi:hypothetical protein